MCRIESYNLNFPDGHSERRERLVNCPRGTPNNPCNRREYTTLFRDCEATQEDIDARARANARLIQPRPTSSSSAEPKKTQDSGSPKSKNHKGVLGGLQLEFNFHNPFSSKKKKHKKEKEKKMIAPTTYPQGTGVSIVERMPRAPSPPPAVPDDRMEPRIIEAMPQKETEMLPNKHEKRRRRRRRHQPRLVVIHQEVSPSESDSDDDEEESSSPSPTRPHRPPGPRSPSPGAQAAAAAHKAEREQRQRDERNAEASRDARQRAQRAHAEEERRERRRRAEQPTRRSLEPVETQQQRLTREAAADEHRRRQYEEDSQIMRAQRYQDAQTPPVRTPQIHQHRRNISFEESGDDFIESAVEDARRRRESASTSNEGSLNSRERGHDRRRYGGSS